MQAADLPARLIADATLLRGRGRAEENSDRVNEARETVARMRSRFSRFGVTRLADVTGLDRIGIPVWMAIRPNAKTLAVSQGKGLTSFAAQASAVMEAAEIAAAEACAVEVRIASARDLAAEGHVVAPFDDMLSRGEAPLGADAAIAWVAGYDLLAGRPVFVPADLVTLDPAGTSGQGSRYWQSTDGLASGNVMLEAVVHGLCERIERDASVLWTLRSDQDVFERCIAPASLGDAAVDDLVARIAASGFQLRLFDITSDVGVPVAFATLAPQPDGREALWKHFDLSSGCGCHPSPARAAIRAITEAAQSRITSITGARDDYDPDLYGTSLQRDLFAYLKAEPGSRAAPIPDAIPETADNLAFMLARLRGAGIGSAIAVPLARDEEAGFAVARILVPELESPPGNRRRRFGRRAMRAMLGAAS